MNNSMTLEEAIDFLAKNCPHVFAPIAIEMQRLRSENNGMKKDLEITQDALNEIIFNTLNGGV